MTDKPEMGRLEFATPRQAWGGEATDFTPLLAKDELLRYLGAECGIGALNLVEVEHPTAGGRYLDILAETYDGRRVAIENQYSDADHDHLTRGLAYAVGTEAAGLIVIAENHRDEFVSVADYLNHVAADDPAAIRVWLVKVRAVRRVGDTIWSPEFVTMAAPNQWEADNAPRRRITLASLEEFYERASESTGPEWAALARDIVNDWLTRPGCTEGHDSQSTVALYFRGTSAKRPTNVLQLTTTGSLTVSRGYIRNIIDPDGQGVLLLDTTIRAVLPDATWPEKGHYITTSSPTFEGYAAVASAILQVMN